MQLRVDGPIGRVTQRVAGSRAFARVAPRVVPPLDKFVHRVTGGRVLLGRVLVPTLMLTTTGAKSGEPRLVPLACVPDGDVIYVTGSNFGREHHPAWTANLMKTPRAHMSFDGEESDVVAHLLSDDEKAAVWPKLLAMWPTYDRYVERSGRNLRVFRLERVPAMG
jgi:deazaflavin-dependent oxidoreductase (nitroreductase family)